MKRSLTFYVVLAGLAFTALLPFGITYSGMYWNASTTEQQGSTYGGDPP